MDAKSILNEAILLSPADRLQLIEGLVCSLDNPDTNIDQTWADESERRVDAIKAGRVATCDLDTILQRYK